MAQHMDSKDRILQAAREEFGSCGFSGARMDRIARKAQINKAMIFYYFSSKGSLYQEILKEALLQVFMPISLIVSQAEHPEPFLEQVPGIYMNFFAKNPDFTRMVAFELVQNPENITRVIRSFFKDRFAAGPGLISEKIKAWHKKGWTTEANPVHFMLNIVSLTLLSFMGRPVIEAIFDIHPSKKSFFREREKSIVNLLKQGMLQ
ncbi:MAG: TetR/AcrR family transcriptional regulator [Pseudomonadota bacterium]